MSNDILTIKVNTEAIKHDVEEKVRKQTKEVIDKGITYAVDSYFAAPNIYQGSKGGDGFTIIDDLVQKVLLSENLQAMVTTAVMNRMNAVISQSIQTSLEHHINRTVWPTVKQVMTPEQEAIMKDAIVRILAIR